MYERYLVLHQRMLYVLLFIVALREENRKMNQRTNGLLKYCSPSL
jgi:hypothetical protein